MVDKLLPHLIFDDFGIRSSTLRIQKLPTIYYRNQLPCVVSIWQKSTLEDIFTFSELLSIQNFTVENEHEGYLDLSTRFFYYTQNQTKSSLFRAVLHLNKLENLQPYSKFNSFIAETVLEYHHHSPDGYAILPWYNPHISTSTYTSTMYNLIDILNNSFTQSLNFKSKLSDIELNRFGMSGILFRHFLNNIGSYDNIRYLEIGIYNGSTLFSILKDNTLDAIAIDSWNNTIFSNINLTEVKLNVFNNLDYYTKNGSNVHIIDKNAWDIDPTICYQHWGGLGANIYFYDGGHESIDHYLALVHYLPCLDDEFILIIDDWGFASVQDGTYAALNSLPIEVIVQYQVISPEVRTRRIHEWHNGMSAFVIRKK